MDQQFPLDLSMPNRACESTEYKLKSSLRCSVCEKPFDRPSLLRRHFRSHTGEKPFECIVCSKGFSTSSSLNTHRRIHTGLAAATLLWKGMSRAASYSLTLFSGEKPHECYICGKRFTASSNLYYHRMTHFKVERIISLSRGSFLASSHCRSNRISASSAPEASLLLVTYGTMFRSTPGSGIFSVAGALADFLKSHPLKLTH